MSERSNKIVLLDSKHCLQILQQVRINQNYAVVAYDLLPYNVESATLSVENYSKLHHCHLVYSVRQNEITP